VCVDEYEDELNRQASVRTVRVSMATNVHRGVKSTAATTAVLITLRAVRSDAGSNLKTKESYDEIAQKALGGQRGDRQIVMMDQHNALNHHYKRGREESRYYCCYECSSRVRLDEFHKTI